ncbi:hypothetical protein CR513_00322, partial [Mucuna pruriens]
MHQLDVKFAFLNGPLEEVYVLQPQGFVVKGEENKVYKLKKALEAAIVDFKGQMMNEFEMSDLGLLSYFLGIEFKITKHETLCINPSMKKDLLRKLNMQQSNPVGTPAEVGLVLEKDTDEEMIDPTHYRMIKKKVSLAHAKVKVAKTVRIGEELPHGSGAGMVHPHGTVHELHPIGFARLDNLVELRGIKSHGLLEQHVLLLARREHRPAHVQARRERHVHGVDVRIVQDGLVGPVDLGTVGKTVSGREGACLVEGAAPDGVQGGVGGEGDGA